jgi:hypothetical protein
MRRRHRVKLSTGAPPAGTAAQALDFGLERLTSEWQSIARRAVASWITAIGMMMLSLELAPHRLPMQPH